MKQKNKNTAEVLLKLCKDYCDIMEKFAAPTRVSLAPPVGKPSVFRGAPKSTPKPRPPVRAPSKTLLSPGVQPPPASMIDVDAPTVRQIDLAGMPKGPSTIALPPDTTVMPQQGAGPGIGKKFKGKLQQGVDAIKNRISPDSSAAPTQALPDSGATTVRKNKIKIKFDRDGNIRPNRDWFDKDGNIKPEIKKELQQAVKDAKKQRVINEKQKLEAKRLANIEKNMAKLQSGVLSLDFITNADPKVKAGFLAVGTLAALYLILNGGSSSSKLPQTSDSQKKSIVDKVKSSLDAQAFTINNIKQNSEGLAQSLQSIPEDLVGQDLKQIIKNLNNLSASCNVLSGNLKIDDLSQSNSFAGAVQKFENNAITVISDLDALSKNQWLNENNPELLNTAVNLLSSQSSEMIALLDSAKSSLKQA